MTTFHFTAETPLPPDVVIDALIDFTERRLTLWPNLDPRFYRVHHLGETWADVTEGSAFLGGVWERDRYDWSTPGVVHLSVTESNAFTSSSFWEYRVTEASDGGSRVEVTVHRVGKSLKGRVVALLLRLVGRRIFSADFRKALDRITAARSVPADNMISTQPSDTLRR